MDDLYKQYMMKYAPIRGSDAHMYFVKMADIEARIYEYVAAKCPLDTLTLRIRVDGGNC